MFGCWARRHLPPELVRSTLAFPLRPSTGAPWSVLVAGLTQLFSPVCAPRHRDSSMRTAVGSRSLPGDKKSAEADVGSWSPTEPVVGEPGSHPLPLVCCLGWLRACKTFAGTGDAGIHGCPKEGCRSGSRCSNPTRTNSVAAAACGHGRGCWVGGFCVFGVLAARVQSVSSRENSPLTFSPASLIFAPTSG